MAPAVFDLLSPARLWCGEGAEASSGTATISSTRVISIFSVPQHALRQRSGGALTAPAARLDVRDGGLYIHIP
jgi:hypothetical protein